MFNQNMLTIAGAIALSVSVCSVAEAATLAFQGSEYSLTDISGTWSQAQAEAESVGGNLVTVNSAEENEFLFNNFVKNDDNTFNRLWIGLTDQEVEGTFQWVSGEPGASQFCIKVKIIEISRVRDPGAA